MHLCRVCLIDPCMSSGVALREAEVSLASIPEMNEPGSLPVSATLCMELRFSSLPGKPVSLSQPVFFHVHRQGSLKLKGLKYVHVSGCSRWSLAHTSLVLNVLVMRSIRSWGNMLIHGPSTLPP